MKIGRFYGIDVHIHWTFWVLIAFYLVSVAGAGGIVEGVIAVAFVLSVFFCVLLHEYGHALAARRYGIRTHDITLMPIGGLARLERMPENPQQELVVAIAGPLVNVAIAAALFGLVSLDVMASTVAPTLQLGTSFFGQLMIVNLLLVAFNMLPAFPMDGGRVLRSLLAMKYSYVRATEIAARIGRWMALAIGLWGVVSWNPMLLILAVFVFLTGTMELVQVKMRSMQQATVFGYGAPWMERSFGAGTQTTGRNEAEVIDAVDYHQVR